MIRRFHICGLSLSGRLFTPGSPRVGGSFLCERDAHSSQGFVIVMGREFFTPPSPEQGFALFSGL